ncbi:DUF397 domain-containing protein [Kitasatospora sp. NPDC101801]|uniref:DUF397 domain-containing protein n=1 Tax=Kitasatospora sp. NPDC101801 TaxID=3364103 RepID=UPI00382A8C94
MNIDLTNAEWQKSSYSNTDGGNCVEPALNFAASHGLVPVRDSKDPNGPALVFTADQWAAFASFAATFQV